MKTPATRLPSHLKTQAERLKWARERFYPSARAASTALEWQENTYKSHENGIRRADGLPLDEARKYARAFRVPLEWLVLNMQAVNQRIEIPLVGKAAAGPNGHFISDYDPGAYPSLELDLDEDTIAVEVEGYSMAPRFKPREKVLFGAATADLDRHVGREVLVRTVDENYLIKILHRNSQYGSYELLSYNPEFEPIHGMGIIWVRPLVGVII